MSDLSPHTMSPETPATPTKQAGSEAGDDVPVPALPTRRPEFTGTRTAHSLSSSSDGLILFDLTNENGGSLEFSPHCTKSIIDLKILNVGYERHRLSFVQVRSELESRITEGVTVPSVELSDGSHLTDSWKIAEYLETKHPSGHLLFPNSGVKAFAAFLQEFGQLIAPHLRILCIPAVASLLDAASKDYYINSKLGLAQYQRAVNASSDEKQTHIASAVKMLATIENALSHGKAYVDSVKGQRRSWLAGTEHPSHADACLFGWYVYTRTAGPAVTKKVWNAHPHVAAWVNDMLAWCGEDIVRDFA